MSENNGDAVELAERAASQGRHAAKNAGRAAKAVAEPALEKVEETIDETIRKVNPRLYLQIGKQSGLAILAVSASVYTAKHALSRVVHAVGFARGVAEAKSTL